MSELIECPYCGQKHDTDGYYEHEEGSLIEVECDNCGKKYQYTWATHHTFDVNQADCLNDGQHVWETIVGYPEEYFVNRIRCKGCGEEKTDPEIWQSLKKTKKA